MPRIYLAVPENPNDHFTNGADEQKYLRELARETVPHLIYNKISCVINPPGMGISRIIDTANRGRFDLVVTLNTSESPKKAVCKLQGSDIYYRSGSKSGVICAKMIYDEIKPLYPYPEFVTCSPVSDCRELFRSKATCIHINTAYRDNSSDAQWLRENTKDIGKALARGICNIFKIEFKPDNPYCYSEISIKGGYLNVRSSPDTNSHIIMRVINGQRVLLLQNKGLWCKINIDGTDGFVNSQYVVSV